jgi:tetratricopeptide (TPR) repeat protein
MQRADATRVDEAIGREIAQREGIDMVLRPEVASAGDAYVLTASLIDPASGVTLRSSTARAARKDRMLDAVDELAARIRASLGEARAAIAQRSRPLARVTKESLEALRLFSLAREAHLGQQFETAKELYEKALVVDPAFAAARAFLGMLSVEFFDRPRGLTLLGEAVKGVDRVTEFERATILAYHARIVENNLPRAAEHLRAYLALHPDTADIHNSLGRVYMFLGQLDLAIAEFQEAIRLEPDLMVSYFSLASIYTHRLADFDAAIATARRQLARNDRSARAYGQLSMAYLGMGDLAQAEAAVRRALDLDTRFVLDWYRLGHILRLQGRHADALAAYERATQVKADEIDAFYHAAFTAQLVGNENLARQHLEAGRALTERVLREDSGDAFVRLKHVALMARAGEQATAVRLLSESDPAVGELTVEYAGVLALLGREAQAIEVLERAMNAGFRDVVLVVVHPDLAGLRGRPTFDAALARMRQRG